MPVRPDTLFLDANVLYSACCRDLLLEAALDGLCHCRWSGQVLSEVRTALLRQRPELRPPQINRLFDLLGLACPEARNEVRPRRSLRLPKPSNIRIASVLWSKDAVSGYAILRSAGPSIVRRFEVPGCLSSPIIWSVEPDDRWKRLAVGNAERRLCRDAVPILPSAAEPRGGSG